MVLEVDAAAIRHCSGELLKLVARATPMLSWKFRTWDGESVETRNGSAFVMHTPEGLFGVTARHVYCGYLECKKESLHIQAMLGNLPVDLENRLIAVGRTADIATFHISEREFPRIGCEPVDGWPPHIPESGGNFLFAGWPGKERALLNGRMMIGGQYAGLTHTQVVTNEQITIRVEQDGLVDPLGVRLPPQNFETGGISGGPLLSVMISRSDNRIKFSTWPAGVLSEGNTTFDCIIAARADVIGEDGRIQG